MKISIVFLVGLCTAVLSTPVADQAQLKKQQQVLRLFYHVNQMSTYPEHVETGKSCFFCDKSSLYEKYEKPEVIDMMENYWKSGLVPRGEIFSIFYTEHFKQAVALFRMFYYAKTWDEFHRAACWARQNVNEGMFVYALSVALIHRPDCCGIMLPPIYEVLPHYFFNKEVINKAYRYKQIHSSHDVQKNPSGYPGFTITTNYTHDHMNLGPEQSMSYYMEDVDLNAAYYYYNLHYPFWMGSEEFGWKEDANRGHIYYYIYQQILAKYYLERISNGAGDIPIVDWKAHVQTPFNPSMMYPCGVDFPVRPKFVKLHEYFYNYGQEWKWSKYGHGFNFMDAFDRRIDDVIDQGFVIDKQGKKVMLDTKEGFNILANLIEHNWDSPNHMYYGPLWRNLRHFMGYSYQAENNWRDIPSALEQYETSMRDPAFYQIAKKLVTKFEKLLTDLPPYTKGELEFPGVTVDSLEFDPLITYNDWFYTDLTNAVFYSGQDDAKTFDVRVRQYRLNHKPFTYKIKMTSDKAQKVSIKVFMGPAHEIQGKTCLLNENRFNYVEFEHIVTDLKAGENVITRSSHDMEYYSPDRMAFREMYKRVKGALEGSEEFKIDGRQNFFQWPQRFMLPRGSASGTPFRFFVMVHPYVPYHEGKYRTDGMPAPGSGGIFIDNQTLGYPLDRFIPDEKMWTSLPNTHCQEVKVYFKDIYDINAPHH